MQIHTFLVAGLLAAATPVVLPPSSGAAPEEIQAREASGELRAVSDNEFTLRTGTAEFVLRTSERTRYTLDGEPAERREVLRTGETVSVRHEGGIALTVDRTTAPGATFFVGETIQGTIRGVESDTMIVAHGDRTTHIRLDETTRYVLDGEASTRDEVVRVGLTVEVEHTGNLALRVERNTSRALAPDSARGTVGDVSEEGFTLTTAGQRLRLTVDAETRYFLDGEPSERASVLRAGRTATVEHTGGRATRVDAASDDALHVRAPIRGEVRAVDRHGFVVEIDEEGPVRLRTDPRTEYRLDGEIAPRTVVLRAGRVVSIAYESDYAMRVAASSVE